jgi:hypothetical protein
MCEYTDVRIEKDVQRCELKRCVDVRIEKDVQMCEYANVRMINLTA